MTAEQLDLFAALADTQRDTWQARFTRAPWHPRHPADDPACAGRLGWVCPACGQVELNGFLLNLNHAYDPDCEAVGYPGKTLGRQFGDTCSELIRQDTQRRIRDQRGAA